MSVFADLCNVLTYVSAPNISRELPAPNVGRYNETFQNSTLCAAKDFCQILIIEAGDPGDPVLNTQLLTRKFVNSYTVGTAAPVSLPTQRISRKVEHATSLTRVGGIKGTQR